MKGGKSRFCKDYMVAIPPRLQYKAAPPKRYLATLVALDMCLELALHWSRPEKPRQDWMRPAPVSMKAMPLRKRREPSLALV